MSVKLSLVVGSGNPVYLHLFLQSLAKYSDYPYDLHVITDNGVLIPDLPDDKNRQNVYTVFQPTGWHGVAHAWNLGLNGAKGDWVGILNDDILFSKNWMTRLVSFIDAEEGLGTTGSVSPIWHWQGVPAIDGLSPAEAWKVVEPWNDRYSDAAFSYGQTNSKETVPGMQGCFFFLNRHALEDMKNFELGMEPHPGLFDETTFSRMNFEDNDMYMRLHRAGYQARITHSVALHHWGSQTVARSDVKAAIGDGYKINYGKFLHKWGLPHLVNKQFTVHNSVFISGEERHPNV